MTGPLHGLKVVEFGGLGPGPFGAMVLADMGADVVRIDRRPNPSASAHATDQAHRYVLHRGRRSVAADLKDPDDRAMVLALIDRADALIDPYRPGVMERLGLGPEVCIERNPRLVYARMTGWGQTGPLRDRAGHDIDYIALAGALRSFARRDQAPVPPLTTVGDSGGGGMLLAFGIVAAAWEAARSGSGQVLDVAIVDGAALLMTMFHGLLAQGRWQEEPGTNFADGAAPDYDVYRTADGEYVAVGALERPFYEELIAKLGFDAADLPDRSDPANWPTIKERFAATFLTRSREEWSRVFEGSDACVTPVLSMTEAPADAHLTARGTFVEYDGIAQPAPAPRFSRTAATLTRRPPSAGEHNREVIADWGIDPPSGSQD